MSIPAAAPQTQPTSLHYLEQLARQRAEHYLHVGNYFEAVRVARNLYWAQSAVKFGKEDEAREILNSVCELTQ